MHRDKGQHGCHSPPACILWPPCGFDGFSGPQNIPGFSDQQLLLSLTRWRPLRLGLWATASRGGKTAPGRAENPGFGPQTCLESLVPTSRVRKGSHVTVFKKENWNSCSPFLLGPWRGLNKVRSQKCFASCQGQGVGRHLPRWLLLKPQCSPGP